MARPKKQGFDYFPKSTALSDRERYLLARGGLKTLGLWLLLRVEILKVGNCFRWGVVEQDSFCFAANCSLEELSTGLDLIFQSQLLSKPVLDATGFLTGKQIQKTYFELCVQTRRREIEIFEEILLIDREDLPPETILINIKKEKEEREIRKEIRNNPEKSGILPVIPVITPKRSKDQALAEVLASRSGPWLDPTPTHALESWITFRKELGKPLTPSGLKAILTKFALDPSEFTRQAEQSIQNGWQGLFPLKDQGGAYSKPKAYEGSSHRDALKRQLAEIRAKQGLKTENEDFL